MKVKEDRTGRTAMWPPYFIQNNPNRVLAVIIGHSLYTETGEALNAETFATFIDLLFNHNLLVFASSISSTEIYPFLLESIQDKKTLVIANKEGIPTSIRIKRKSSTRWIVPYKSWEKVIHETYTHKDFLSHMRQMYNYVGVGTRPTPSSSGTALLQIEWGKNHFASLSGCNRMCADFIYKYRIGSRCDTTVTKGTHFDELIELDMASGFSAHYCQKIPFGTSIRDSADTIEQNNYFTYIVRCFVTIKEELALGPFPVRKQKQNKIQYPTLPGTYETTLWKEQIEDAREVGCKVIPFGYGYAWRDSTEDMTVPAQKLYQLRIHAPNEAIEKDIKRITVGAWGRFGMNNTFYSLVDDNHSQLGEKCIVDDNFDPLDFYVQEEKDYKQVSMIHQYSYNIMQCARTLYRYALPYAREGRLIMTNYDAIIVVEKDETYKYVQKHTLEALMCNIGDLRWKRLTNVTILGDRSLKCDQYVSMPGVKRT